jgi:hypothetical protein
VKKDKRREEGHKPIFWPMLLHQMLVESEYLVTEWRKNALDEDGSRLIVHVGRRRQVGAEGTLRDFALNVSISEAPPASFYHSTTDPKTDDVSQKYVLEM